MLAAEDVRRSLRMRESRWRVLPPTRFLEPTQHTCGTNVSEPRGGLARKGCYGAAEPGREHDAGPKGNCKEP
jgi:hypothetical protein